MSIGAMPSRNSKRCSGCVTTSRCYKHWVREQLPEACARPPLAQALATLQTVMEQDLEPDPDKGGVRIRDGVAKDRAHQYRGR